MPTPPPDRAALARQRLAAKARRASNLRRRVVAGALASFALAWGVIAFNGPMGVQATTTASTQATPTATTTETPSSDQSQSSSSSDNSASSDNTVTTAQS